MAEQEQMWHFQHASGERVLIDYSKAPDYEEYDLRVDGDVEELTTKLNDSRVTLSAAEARAEKAEAERDEWQGTAFTWQKAVAVHSQKLEAMRFRLSRIQALTEEPLDDPLFWEDLNLSAHDVAQAVNEIAREALAQAGKG